MFRATFLCNTVLLLRQFVTNEFLSRLFIIARIDTQPGKQFHLRSGDMAVTIRILLQIVLVVLLGRIVGFQRANLHEELPAASLFNPRDALHRLLRFIICVVNTGLILTAPVVALPVFYRRINNIEVSQKQGIKTHLLRIILHPHGLPKSGVSLADGLVVCVCFIGTVSVAALGIKDTGNGLHQLFHAPEATASQIDDVFCGIHPVRTRLAGHIRGLSDYFLCIRFLRYIFLPDSASTQQHRDKQQPQISMYHGILLSALFFLQPISSARA